MVLPSTIAAAALLLMPKVNRFADTTLLFIYGISHYASQPFHFAIMLSAYHLCRFVIVIRAILI